MATKDEKEEPRFPGTNFEGMSDAEVMEVWFSRSDLTGLKLKVVGVVTDDKGRRSDIDMGTLIGKLRVTGVSKNGGGNLSFNFNGKVTDLSDKGSDSETVLQGGANFTAVRSRNWPEELAAALAAS